MASQDESDKISVLEFADFLKKLKEDVLDSYGGDSRPCNEVMGWDYPPFGKQDVVDILDQIYIYLHAHKFNENEEFYDTLTRCKKDLSEWSAHLGNFYHGNYAKTVVLNFVFIAGRLERSLRNCDQDLRTKDLQSSVKLQQERIQSLEKRLNSAENSVGDIEGAIGRITEAEKTAIQLPETLSSLEAAKRTVDQIESTVRDAEKNILDVSHMAEEQHEFVANAEEQIEKLLEKSRSVLAAAASAGWAGAFYDRKKELQIIGWVWSGALIVALCAAVGTIWWRADHLFALMDKANDIGTFVLIANFAISIGFVGAPIWLAWLATKQIGYYFRLSEDYAFKASVSASYEGFMEEARQHDAEFQKKVLESTLERYDEAPLRFVDTRVHGSPYNELFESEEFKAAMKNIPGFKEHVIASIKRFLNDEEQPSRQFDVKSEADQK